MAKFLKKNATYTSKGITLIGDGKGADGVLSIIGFEKIDRINYIATVTAAIYVDNTTERDHKNKLDEIHFNIFNEGELRKDFDQYIQAAPIEGEVGGYLHCIHRAYQYMTDKAALYALWQSIAGDEDNENYAEYMAYKEFKQFSYWVD